MSTWGSNRGQDGSQAALPASSPGKGPAHLPLFALRVPDQVEQRQRVKKLQNWEEGLLHRVLLETARWTGAQVQLTCPKKRKGSRKVRPATSGLEALCRGTAGQRGPVTQSPKPGGKDRPSRCPGRTAGQGAALPDFTHSEVHGVPLTQGAQAVQAAALVVILWRTARNLRRGGIRTGWSPKPLPPFLGGGLSRAGTSGLLWYMEKDRNWFELLV